MHSRWAVIRRVEGKRNRRKQRITYLMSKLLAVQSLGRISKHTKTKLTKSYKGKEDVKTRDHW